MPSYPNHKPALTKMQQRLLAEIASLTDWLACSLEDCEDEQPNWQNVDSLQQIRFSLIENLVIISGLSKTQIQRSLAELYM